MSFKIIFEIEIPEVIANDIKHVISVAPPSLISANGHYIYRSGFDNEDKQRLVLELVGAIEYSKLKTNVPQPVLF